MDKLEVQRIIGFNIIEKRKELGLSQADLARRLNKDRQSLEKVENGKVNVTIFSLYEIALALDVNMEELVQL